NATTIEDKSEIAENTSRFIRERLAIIEGELGAVESDIERLKTSNQGVDVETSGQMYLSESRQSEAERNTVETEIKLAEMMRDHLRAGESSKELIPNNTGLVDGNVESQIAEYNAALLRRNRLEEGSSSEN